MVESLAVLGIILNLIRPPQQLPPQYPYQYPAQHYYQPQPPQVPYYVQPQENRNYPTEYQTSLGSRSWSQAGSLPYNNGQQAQTPTNSIWR